MSIRKRVVSVEDFATALDIKDKAVVRRWCQAGLLKTIPKDPGSKQAWKIHTSEIDRVMESGFPVDPKRAAA